MDWLLEYIFPLVGELRIIILLVWEVKSLYENILDKLYEIVDKRVDLMVEEGLVTEVKNLYNQGIRSKAIETGIGYKELYAYFDKQVTLEEAINNIKKNTRHFIKRQYTFFKHQMDVNWVNVNFQDFKETIQESLKIIHED